MTSQDALNAAIEEFQTSTLGQEMLDAEKARNNCLPVALALLVLLQGDNIEDARLMSVGGLKAGDDPNYLHYVVKVGTQVVDPSQRQFEESADVPMIEEATTYEDRWEGWNTIDLDDELQRSFHPDLPADLPDWSEVSNGLDAWSDAMKSAS